MSFNLPNLEEIRTEFAELDQASDRLAYLIELGESLPDFPDAERTEANRVQGCQSQVWLIARPAASDKHCWDFLADSDAPMVKGLAAILVTVYSGRTSSEMLQFPVERLFEQLQLRTFLSPLRSNGLFSMVRFVRDLAERQLGKSLPAVETVIAKAPSRTINETPLSDAEIESLRTDFPILQTKLESGHPLVYLDNAATTQRPRQVLDAMTAAYEQYFSNVHRGGHELAARTTEQYESAREACRRLIGAQRSHEIIFTSGTTAGINCVARAWGDSQVRAGDEVLLSVMEHHSNIVPWQQLAERTGCTLRYVPVTAAGHLDLEAFHQLLGPRTRIVALTAVSNVLGTINPLKPLIAAAHSAGAVVLVDAAQAAPHQTLDVIDLDADFLVFSGHKLLGPSGVGVLYGKERLLEAMPPFLGGGSMIGTVTLDGYTTARLPAKFEAGTPPIVPAIGLGAAIAYLERIGMSRIHAHEQRLTAHAHRRLADLSGVQIVGPPVTEKGGIVTFSVAGLQADEVAKALDAWGVAIRAGHHCAMPLHAHLGLSASSRASFYLYNSLAEVDQFVDSLGKAIQLFRRQ